MLVALKKNTHTGRTNGVALDCVRFMVLGCIYVGKMEDVGGEANCGEARGLALDEPVGGYEVYRALLHCWLSEAGL